MLRGDVGSDRTGHHQIPIDPGADQLQSFDQGLGALASRQDGCEEQGEGPGGADRRGTGNSP